MSTGPEHYQAAETNLELAIEAGHAGKGEVAAVLIAAAQAQATLALVAATADAAVTRWIGDENTSGSDWTRVLS